MGKIAKIRLNHGKHPVVTKLINIIFKVALPIDPLVRIIPGRFSTRKGSQKLIEALINSENKKEILIKILDKKIIQYIKAECSSFGKANLIKELLNQKSP